jgi:hypothetical protein
LILEPVEISFLLNYQASGMPFVVKKGLLGRLTKKIFLNLLPLPLLHCYNQS